MNAYGTEKIEFAGRSFSVSFYYDEHHGAPWQENDCHGPVREIRRKDEKRPGERIIHDERGNFWAYDFQAAIEEARAKWGIKSGPEAVKFVENDIKYLRGYLRNDWHFCGVAVNILDPDGEPIGSEFDNAIWGIESSSGDYLRELANELAADILHERLELWKKHLKERRAVKYWASRDVITQGAQE